MCQYDCGNEATEVVVTVNGWLIDACHSCAIRECDHLASVTSPALDGAA